MDRRPEWPRAGREHGCGERPITSAGRQAPWIGKKEGFVAVAGFTGGAHDAIACALSPETDGRNHLMVGDEY